MRWLWLSVIIVALDQASKFMVSEHLADRPPLELTPWLNLILAYNTGAAFSFLGDAGGWQRWFFILLAVMVSIFLLLWLLRARHNPWLSCALALVLGGAVGNLIDRVHLGHVVDFIDFHLGNWHFATFNLADSAITIGAILLLIDAFFLQRAEED